MARFPLTGGCNCGAVRYEVSAPLVAASYCHCRRCQRRSGAAASPNAHPAPGTFRIVAGEDRLRVWRPDEGGEKWFCGDCGSSLFGRNPSHADPIGIRMGTFDEDPGIRPSARQFVRYAAPWEPIPDDGLPRHPESRHSRGSFDLGAVRNRAIVTSFLFNTANAQREIRRSGLAPVGLRRETSPERAPGRARGLRPPARDV